MFDKTQFPVANHTPKFQSRPAAGKPENPFMTAMRPAEKTAAADQVKFSGLFGGPRDTGSDYVFGDERGERVYSKDLYVDANEHPDMVGKTRLVVTRGVPLKSILLSGPSLQNPARLLLKEREVEGSVSADGAIQGEDCPRLGGEVVSNESSVSMARCNVGLHVRGVGDVSLVDCAVGADAASSDGNMTLIRSSAQSATAKDLLLAEACTGILGTLKSTGGQVQVNNCTKIQGDIDAYDGATVNESIIKPGGLKGTGKVSTDRGKLSIKESKIAGAVQNLHGDLDMQSSETESTVDSGGNMNLTEIKKMGSASAGKHLKARNVASSGDLIARGGDLDAYGLEVDGKLEAQGSITKADYCGKVGALIAKTGNISALETRVLEKIEAPNGSIRFIKSEAGGTDTDHGGQFLASGNIEIEECSGVGGAKTKLGNISIKETDVNGPLTAGEDLQGSKQPANTGGNLLLNYADVSGPIEVYGKAVLENEAIAKQGITIHGPNAELHLKSDANVIGKIKFPDGGGKVILHDSCQINPANIEGGAENPIERR